MDALIDRLAAIVGEANVSASADELRALASDRSFVHPMLPRCIVKAHSAEEVQVVIRLANETGTPVVPVSSGAPHFHGDTVPGRPESIILDLSGMKKIVSINKLHRMAVIEPGVTYGELEEALAKEGMTFAHTLAPRSNKSVLTSVLEVEPRLNAVHGWSYTEPLRCLEVVWGDGKCMSTGEAGNGPLDISKQQAAEKWQVDPFGPMMLDYYRVMVQGEGTMGVATWASVRCELRQQAHRSFFLAADTEKELLDVVWDILHVRFSEELFIMNKAQAASLMGESREEIEALKTALPAWLAFIGVGGRELLPEERCEQQAADVGEFAQKHGKQLLASVGGVSADRFYARAIRPSPAENYWKDKSRGAAQDIFFLTTIDRTAEFIDKMTELAARAGYPVDDVGAYVQPEHMGSSYHVEFTLPYDPACERSTACVRRLFETASEEFARMGAFYARPYGPWARLQLNKDAMSYGCLQKLKNIFDPNGIMNPGKVTI